MGTLDTISSKVVLYVVGRSHLRPTHAFESKEYAFLSNLMFSHVHCLVMSSVDRMYTVLCTGWATNLHGH